MLRQLTCGSVRSCAHSMMLTAPSQPTHFISLTGGRRAIAGTTTTSLGTCQSASAPSQEDGELRLERFRRIADLGAGDAGVVTLVELLPPKGADAAAGMGAASGRHLFALKSMDKKAMEERNKVRTCVGQLSWGVWSSELCGQLVVLLMGGRGNAACVGAW